MLRVEDTDQTRYVPGAEEYIVDALNWCNIKVDEGVGVGGEFGPYRQSERKEMYRQYADRLISSGHAYYAFDTPEELEEMRQRMKNAEFLSAIQPSYAYFNEEFNFSFKDEVKARVDMGEPHVIRVKMPRNEEVKSMI